MQSKFDFLTRKTAIGLLLQSLCHLEKLKLITLHPKLKDLLKVEGLKYHIPRNRNKNIPTKLKIPAKELKNKRNIVLGNADYSNTYVILHKLEYHKKICTPLTIYTASF